MTYDVIIAGGGPAGLSAGIILGRCRRKVLIIDAGEPRNRRSHGMHGFITRDGILPEDFLLIADQELQKYSVQKKKDYVVHVKKTDSGFLVFTKKGKEFSTKKFVMATGLSDKIPSIPGAEKLYGKFIFHCPYCDGWELSDKKIGFLLTGKYAGMAELLRTWTQQVIVYTNGASLSRNNIRKLEEKKIIVCNEVISRLRESSGELEILFDTGRKERISGLFFSTDFYQKTELGIASGCDYSPKGLIKTDHLQKTRQGFYVIGDAARDMQMVIVAAAEGVKAGIALNIELNSDC